MKKEKHTRFLSQLVNMNKTFRVLATVKKSNSINVTLDTSNTQADQGFDINIMSMRLTRVLSLQLHLLFKIEFKGLSMRTANHRDIVLKY